MESRKVEEGMGEGGRGESGDGWMEGKMRRVGMG